jgi:hypothetical protein
MIAVDRPPCGRTLPTIPQADASRAPRHQRTNVRATGRETLCNLHEAEKALASSGCSSAGDVQDRVGIFRLFVQDLEGVFSGQDE